MYAFCAYAGELLQRNDRPVVWRIFVGQEPKCANCLVATVPAGEWGRRILVKANIDRGTKTARPGNIQCVASKIASGNLIKRAFQCANHKRVISSRCKECIVKKARPHLRTVDHTNKLWRRLVGKSKNCSQRNEGLHSDINIDTARTGHIAVAPKVSTKRSRTERIERRQDIRRIFVANELPCIRIIKIAIGKFRVHFLPT